MRKKKPPCPMYLSVLNSDAHKSSGSKGIKKQKTLKNKTLIDVKLSWEGLSTSQC